MLYLKGNLSNKLSGGVFFDVFDVIFDRFEHFVVGNSITLRFGSKGIGLGVIFVGGNLKFA